MVKTSSREQGTGGGGQGGSGGTSSGTAGSSRCCAGPDSSSSSPASAAPCGAELVQSLKLVSLCLGSQLHGAKYILDPQKALFSSVKVPEFTWKMCTSAPGLSPSTDLDPVRTKKLRNNSAPATSV